jgi:uncharacterized protein DUF998
VSVRPEPDVPSLSAPRTRARPAPALAAAGLGAIAVGSALIVLLHVIPPSDRVNPLTRTISEYALGANAWMFNTGVLALAAGSAAVLVALARLGVVRPVAPATLLVLGWTAGLVVLVVFEKYDFARGEHTGASGMIHRMASLVAFLCLPIGGLLAARTGLRAAHQPHWRRPATRTRWAALLACALLCLLCYAVGQSFVTGVAWWRVFPLGGLERLIALGEIAVLLTLGSWALGASRSPAPLGRPGYSAGRADFAGSDS